MKDERDIAQLRSDIKRWRARLSEAESTYCQGVANKAAKQFEALIKRLAEQRVAAAGCDLGSLLVDVRYTGEAQSITRLPLGTVTQLIPELTRHDNELETACTPDT